MSVFWRFFSWLIERALTRLQPSTLSQRCPDGDDIQSLLIKRPLTRLQPSTLSLRDLDDDIISDDEIKTWIKKMLQRSTLNQRDTDDDIKSFESGSCPSMDDDESPQSGTNCFSMDSYDIYDVFMSFRGTDTRNTFVDHLYANLVRKGIFVFKDDKQLRKGESISHQLLRAIRNSRISIIVFSKRYASSTWCLDEMNQIAHCRAEMNQIVFPVFYDVDPSHVRKQNGVYRYAFALHSYKYPHKVSAWKRDMACLASLAGWDVRDKPEFEQIENIVQAVIEKLGRKFSGIADELIGIQPREPLPFRCGFDMVLPWHKETNGFLENSSIVPFFFDRFKGGSIGSMFYTGMHDNWLGFLFYVSFEINNDHELFNSPLSSLPLPHPVYLSFESEHTEERFDMPLNLDQDDIRGNHYLWIIYIYREHCHFVKRRTKITFKACKGKGLILKEWGLRVITKGDIEDSRMVMGAPLPLPIVKVKQSTSNKSTLESKCPHHYSALLDSDSDDDPWLTPQPPYIGNRFNQLRTGLHL